MPILKLKEFLEQNGVKYEVVTHAPAFTAQRTADSAHIKGRDVAKTVMVKIDGKLAMAVLPAAFKVNLELLKKTTGAQDVSLASERDFKDVFPDCEVGAMPPFGNLYGMHVLVARALAEDEEIAFNAGSHTELIRLSFKEFERLVKPKVVRLSSGLAVRQK